MPQPLNISRPDQPAGDRARVVVVDDPAPERLTGVGGDRVGPAVPADRDREVAAVGDPVRGAEPAAQGGGLQLQPAARSSSPSSRNSQAAWSQAR